MSFRKRNANYSQPRFSSLSLSDVGTEAAPGSRPSPLDGRLTISTGTKSLDSLLAGHAGFPVGTSLLIEESGTTDFGNTILRYFAAEGLVQSHFVHVLGVNAGWGRELPGLADMPGGYESERDKTSVPGDKMKIAWRYERLGEFGIERENDSLPSSSAQMAIFCHSFDLSKRLLIASPSLLNIISTPQGKSKFRPRENLEWPLDHFLRHLASALSLSPSSSIHRVVISSLLSPTMYPHQGSNPNQVLQFFHSLRALLRKYPKQLTVVVTVPLSLYPRTTGLTRWIEILNDGVIELAPFASQPASISVRSLSKPIVGEEDFPQGMMKVHRLPIFHERGGGGIEIGCAGDDLTFTFSRRRGLLIKSFSLPPVDNEKEHTSNGNRKATSADMEF